MAGRPHRTRPGFRPALEPLDGRVLPHAGRLAGPPPGLFDAPAVTAPAPQVATRLAVQVQRTVDAGGPARVTVIALDGSGRPVPDYTGTVTLTSSDPAATLPAAYTFTSADRGRHAFAVTLATAGSQTVTATDGAATPLTGSGRVGVTAAAVASKLFVTAERSAYVGAPARLVVVALDANNRPVPTYTGTVTLTSTDGGAALPASYTFTAADRGVKVLGVTPSAVGTQTVTATDAAGLTGRVGISVQAAPAVAELVVRVVPGRDGTAQVLVAALDAGGRPVPTYTGAVTLSSTDPAATLPAAYTFTGADRGLKVFPVTLPTAGTTAVTAADAGGLTASQDLTRPAAPTAHGKRPRGH